MNGISLGKIRVAGIVQQNAANLPGIVAQNQHRQIAVRRNFIVRHHQNLPVFPDAAVDVLQAAPVVARHMNRRQIAKRFADCRNDLRQDMRGVVHILLHLQAVMADHRAAVCMRGHEYQLSRLQTIAFLQKPARIADDQIVPMCKVGIDIYDLSVLEPVDMDTDVEILADAFTRLRAEAIAGHPGSERRRDTRLGGS